MDHTLAISLRCLREVPTSPKGRDVLSGMIERLLRADFALSVPPLRGIELIAPTLDARSVVEVIGPWQVDLYACVAATRWERVQSLARRHHLLGGFLEARGRVEQLASMWPDAVAVDTGVGDPVEHLVYHSTRDALVEIVTRTQRPLVVDLYHWNKLLGEQWTAAYCGLLEPHNIASVHVNTRDLHDWGEFLAGRSSRLAKQLAALHHVGIGTPIVVEVPQQLFALALSDLCELRARIVQAMSE